MDLLAHSARPNWGIPAQPYTAHILHVMDYGIKNARKAANYSRENGERLIQAVRLAAEFHDLGKIEEANQKVLASGSGESALPINHVDAGVAYLLNDKNRNMFAASLVYAHHIGLPDFQDQRNNPQGYVLRDNTVCTLGQSTKFITDQLLNDYLKVHRSFVSTAFLKNKDYLNENKFSLSPLLFRIALSCLVDADHYDTACHYGQSTVVEGPDLRPAERLSLLDDYVVHLDKENESERAALRDSIYSACRHANPSQGIYACDSPVGTGKTTAVMAHLLCAAVKKNLRRIIVVLPFTNIIDQSVEVYRLALVDSSEHANDIVAAHHHRAEFNEPESRQFAFLWHAPIVVTTAVQFFETLASNHPSALRKLHQLPGSAIFIDEAHAALPSYLWPQAWRWLMELESEWSCHFVLGSGSLNRFWEFEEFSNKIFRLPDLISVKVRKNVFKYEKHRVQYKSKSSPLNHNELIEWLSEMQGPRLLIVNTVQSAAVIAADIAELLGRKNVEHLSTSLCPRDRKITLDRVKHRLNNKSDKDWTLVATSCVEAGINLSFHNGFRERCSLNSLIQIGGRVNRQGEYSDSIVWDFQLRPEGFIRAHPAFDTSAYILGELFKEGLIGPEFSTEAMRREIRQDGLKAQCDEIITAEKNWQFPIVSDKFKVIDSNTITVIVDRNLIKKLENREKINPELIQACSVQIWRYREIEYVLKSVLGYPGLYFWTLLYDDFLGYMSGVLQNLKHKQYGTIF